MRVRDRSSEWRWFWAAAFLVSLPFLAFASSCTPRDPYYDGGSVQIFELPKVVRLTITNNRVTDAIDPHFYLTSNGKHPLGIVHGLGETKTVLVDTNWIRSDGVITITAHYAGGPDLIYDQFIWKPGDRIEVSLDNIFNPISAWSHR